MTVIIIFQGTEIVIGKFISLEDAAPKAMKESAQAIELEYAEASGEITSDLNDAEAAMDSVGELEALVVKAEEIQERDGGVSEQTAEVLDMAVESIYARLGLKKKPTPALEGIVDNKTGMRNITVALENWKQKIADFWKMIKDAFFKMIDWIKSFFVSANKKVKQQNEKMEELTTWANKKTGTESIGMERGEPGEHTLSLLAQKHLHGILGDDSNHFMNEIKKTFRVFEQVEEGLFGVGNGDQSEFESQYRKFTESKPETKEEAYAMFEQKMFSKNCLTRYGGEFEREEDGMGIHTLSVVDETTEISYRFPSPEITDGKVFKEMEKLSCKLKYTANKPNAKTAQPDLLSQEQMVQLYKLFLSNGDKIAKNLNEGEKEMKESLTAFTGFIKKAEESNEKDNKVTTQVNIEILKGTYKLILSSKQLLTQLCQLNLQLRDAIFDYCVYSVKSSGA